MVPEQDRWEGRIEAQLEAVTNELLPLKPVPGHLALVANTVERMERLWLQREQDREVRDKQQDERLERIETLVAKGNNRRALLLGLVPVFVALITTAGFLLKG
jgi:hypothetical protein